MSCPRFEACSCNECPLDPLAAMHGGSHQHLEGEEQCRARRSSRERIAVAHGLPAAWALLPRERANDARREWFAALPAEERERRADALRSTSAPLYSPRNMQSAAAMAAGTPPRRSARKLGESAGCRCAAGEQRRAA